MRPLACLCAPLLALVAFAGPAPAQQAGGAGVVAPAAVVNDRVVTNYDIDQRARLLLFNGAPQTAELGRIAFDQLVEDQLKLEAGEAVGITREDVDLGPLLEAFAQQRGLTREALPDALARVGATLSALEYALSADAIWRTVVRQRFGAQALPSEAEIDREISLGGSVGGVSYRLAEIAIPITGRGEAEARALADQVYAELRGGGDFASAARRYSGAPSAAEGGEIGWLTAAVLPPEARAALAAVRPGEVTAPFRTPNAYALLRLEERREAPRLEAGAAQDPELREQVRRAMTEARLSRLADGYMQELRSDAVIERR